MMRRILTIARREYSALVATRAFVIGLCVTPVLVLGGILIPAISRAASQQVCQVAVVDHTGKLVTALQRELVAGEQTSSADWGPNKVRVDQSEPQFELEVVDSETFNDEQRLALSDRIRCGDLYGFLEIPAAVLNNDPAQSSVQPLWISDVTMLSRYGRRLSAVLSDAIGMEMLARELDTAELAFVRDHSAAETSLEIRSPYIRDAAGEIRAGDRKNAFSSVIVPLVLLLVMFLVVMLSAQPMVDSVLEEKTLRISELLLGSATARQLMIGKLLGNVAGSLTILLVYLVSGYLVALAAHPAAIPDAGILAWYLFFQILAVLLFSAVFMCVAASVTQMREAQCLLMPVWGLIMLPMFLLLPILEEPNSMLATTLSYLPPAAPMVMTIRMTSGTPISPYALSGSVVAMVAGTVLCVVAAARIYRGGLLHQGQAVMAGDVLRWLLQTDDTQ